MDQNDSGFADEPRPRPTGVIVIAIIALVFGFLGTCCSPLSIASFMNKSNPMIAAYWQDPWIIGSSFGGIAIGFVFGILKIILGYGLLKFKSWARSPAVAFALIESVTYVCSSGLNIFVVQPRIMALLPATPGLPPGFQQNMFLVGLITGIGCVGAMFIYNLFVAYYLTRPNVKAAFESQS